MGLWLAMQNNIINSISARSTFLGLWLAEQSVGTLNIIYFHKLCHSNSQNNTSDISNKSCSEILGLWLAEQNVGSLNKYTFRNSGTPVRRTKHRESHKIHFPKCWNSSSQNKTSETSNKLTFIFLGLWFAEQRVGNLNHVLSELMGLAFAEQDVGHLNNMFSFQNLRDSGSQNKTSEI